MPASRRVLSALLSASLTLVGVLALGWLWLYLDSFHERQRADHLIADLKSFPFATAGFIEVRELANRYGGTAVQSFPVLQFLPPGPPLVKFPGSTDPQERMPLVRTRPTCTPQDCIFDIWIRPRLFKLPLNYETSWFLYSGLARVGLRPWVVGGRFEVRDGKLWESRTGVGQFRHTKIGSYEGLILLGYQVISMSRAKALDTHRPEYAVCVPLSQAPSRMICPRGLFKSPTHRSIVPSMFAFSALRLSHMLAVGSPTLRLRLGASITPRNNHA